jgi:hypothetical protein
MALLSGNSSTSACKSETWIVRRSSTARPEAVPRRGNAPTGLEGIGPSRATRRSPSPSTWKIPASKASHRRAALLSTAANTGWTSLGELEMTRRISAVAVCCSNASLRALVISASDGAGGPLGLAVRGVPHASQNVACGRFSCWHRGHRIPSVSRVRIVSACQGLRVTTPGPPPELSVPAVPWGTGAPTLP